MIEKIIETILVSEVGLLQTGTGLLNLQKHSGIEGKEYEIDLQQE